MLYSFKSIERNHYPLKRELIRSFCETLGGNKSLALFTLGTLARDTSLEQSHEATGAGTAQLVRFVTGIFFKFSCNLSSRPVPSTQTSLNY